MADPVLRDSTAGLISLNVVSASSSALNVAVGDFLMVATTTYDPGGANSLSAVTDTIGNLYVRAGSAIGYATGTGRWDVWYTASPVASANAANVVTIKYAASTLMDSCILWQAAWSWGGAATIAFNAEVAAVSVSGSTIASLSVSTSFADSLVVGSFDWLADSATYANGTGTIIGTPTSTNKVYFAYRNTDAAGAYSIGLSGGPAGGPIYAAIAKSFHIATSAGGAAASPVRSLPTTNAGT